ncbi:MULTISPECIES: DUF6192 family protein [unclassified Streptomyces]|uniref:DUF6192 family protein n=1 Tax=unclassified Streptomyces TaxID=2593676 RepID=UPI001F313AF7|nr:MULTISPECIES: DUF6192 family protein [unclassified Streptomyces]
MSWSRGVSSRGTRAWRSCSGGCRWLCWSGWVREAGSTTLTEQERFAAVLTLPGKTLWSADEARRRVGRQVEHPIKPQEKVSAIHPREGPRRRRHRHQRLPARPGGGLAGQAGGAS